MVAPTRPPVDGISIALVDVEDEIINLTERLERGWNMIDEHEASGRDTSRLFAHFNLLLADYEHAIDRMRALRASP